MIYWFCIFVQDFVKIGQSAGDAIMAKTMFFNMAPIRYFELKNWILFKSYSSVINSVY